MGCEPKQEYYRTEENAVPFHHPFKCLNVKESLWLRLKEPWCLSFDEAG